MNKTLQKKKIRKILLKKRMEYNKDELDIFSKKIIKKIEKSDEYKNAKNILFYMPIKNEVNIYPLITKALIDKNVYLPKTQKNGEISIHKIDSLFQIENGRYNIPEPTTKKQNPDILDLIIVPGIAHDKKQHRIGFGKGYYDKFLKLQNCKKIALAYEFQIVENIPAEEHDQKVDKIITNSNIYD